MAQEAQELQRRGLQVGESDRRRPLRVLLGPVRGVGLGRWVSVTVLLLFVALRSWDPAPVETLRLKTFDLYQNIRPREAAVQVALGRINALDVVQGERTHMLRVEDI